MSAPAAETAAEGKTTFALRGHNPDVLTCIANLSNDEVFTPPELANQMLDTLADAWAEANGGASLWADSSVTFLDPFTKSGVFLREITARLVAGLADEIPDLQERVDHILTRQVFGIGITSLTALLARRSVYCSKYATGPHSIAKSFDRDWGNIWFERTEHTWAGDRCVYCGAGRAGYDRDDDLETHAYAFIHTSDIKARLARMFGADMQFDVIIGNPPYQLTDGGGGGSARPIYPEFIRRALAMEPRYLCMVTPSRWMSGGRGLDGFRAEMLANRHIRVLVDFVVAADAFPGVNINGGVNYFLWERDNEGDCEVVSIGPGGNRGPGQMRSLGEFDTFIRRNEAVSVLRRVAPHLEQNFSRRVSSTKPFGLRTDFHGTDQPAGKDDVLLYGSGRVSWVSRDQIKANLDWVDRWKVLVAAATDGNEIYPLPIWDQRGPFIAAPGEACTETYLVAALAENRAEAERIIDYMRTRFFRFMVSLRKVAQHNKADNFKFVPDFVDGGDHSDEALCRRYGLSSSEIAFIETQIRAMEFSSD